MPVRNTFDAELIRTFLRDGCRETLHAAAAHAAVRAMIYCPVKSGHMRSTIRVLDSNDGTMSTVYVGAYYAPFVELGHLTPAGTWVAPHPFMRMALEDTAEAWPQIVQTAFAYAGEAAMSRADGPHLGAEFTAGSLDAMPADD